MNSSLHHRLSPSLQVALAKRQRETGQSIEEIVEAALGQYLEVDEETIFQTSTISALVEGVNKGDLTVGELVTHGNFGLGTFDDLDGEMVLLDGEVLQLKSDGQAYAVAESAKTPFATVTFWEADRTVVLNQPLDYSQLQAYLDTLLPSDNIFYAIKVEGSFEFVKTRSVARQVEQTRLIDATAQQPVFEFHQVQGTLVGFWTPTYMQTVNVPGYHFHFLTQDRRQGGHLLDCRIGQVTIGIDDTPQMRMALPNTSDFLAADLSKDTREELHQSEK
ncbi:hypothetical protein DO97_05100 [Neosynechococcus sphagnicola sy1]|uniref:Alpha-acetolactate decarboxylase n=1 Tax=Neosynechococcus sphagnicola sy1 TaxID=1497020 RepID=A0A098TKA3_9CYAN|nr:acetolactate decarboxylase [Neosynechococcus sphagnicola]KGF72729.1 hypothetical protein DO97_05100 [Neosynechococcus sphagnicola sy1]